MSAERTEFKMDSGRVLHELGYEDHLYGHFEVQPDGTARVWNQVSADEFAATEAVFPGPISCMRALLDGAV